jgi:hypothetical protein
MPINLITATHSDFEPFVGQKFDVAIEGGKVELVLDNVKIIKSSNIRDNHLEIDGVVYPVRQPFALTFEGPREPILEPITYSVFHDKAGKMELFVSAFRQDHDCMLYETVFT